MENHPEINWSEVTRQAIQEKIEVLEIMDELASESDLTESDVQEIADKINESGRPALTKNRRELDKLKLVIGANGFGEPGFQIWLTLGQFYGRTLLRQ